MDTQEKKTLSEADIKAKFITPSIVSAGWNEIAHIRREVTLTPGPVVVRGNLSSRNRKKRKFADYVLQKEKGVPVAVGVSEILSVRRQAAPSDFANFETATALGSGLWVVRKNSITICWTG